MNVFEEELRLLDEEYAERRKNLINKIQEYKPTYAKDFRTQEEGPFKDREREKHPSYGIVSITRTQYNGKGKRLFGSGIGHGTVITIKISTGEKSRNSYSEHYFQKNKILEFQLSAAQFTSMITNMNTEGTPCTLSWIKGTGYIDEAPINNIREEMHDDLKKRYEELAKQVKDLEQKTEEKLKGSLKKTDKEAILNNIRKVEQNLRANLPFLQECHNEALENAGASVQAEAEAAITGMINRMGLETLRDQLTEVNTKMIKN